MMQTRALIQFCVCQGIILVLVMPLTHYYSYIGHGTQHHLQSVTYWWRDIGLGFPCSVENSEAEPPVNVKFCKLPKTGLALCLLSGFYGNSPYSLAHLYTANWLSGDQTKSTNET